MKLAVGLGNPGREYTDTRHNLGFQVVDKFARENNWHFTHKKFQGLYTEGNWQQKRVILLKPQTFMNLSGESVSALMHFYKIRLDHLLVIHDDLDLEPGAVRYREKGSAGGHNGLKSIIEHLKTENFARIKIGIGKPRQKANTARYVLEQFSAEENLLMEPAIDNALEKLESWLDV